MKRVALYARVSTTKQTDTSIETQLKTMREYCARKGWVVVDEFAEKESGGKVDRPEFKKMIANALAGKYDVILVEKFDRFFRDDIEDRRITRLLESKGVYVISALEGIDPTSASGKLLRWLLSDVNWFQREYMKEEMMRKNKEAARQGYWLGGIPPYGFKLVEVKEGARKRKKLAINEEEAEVVRQIFKMYADGWSCKQIAQWLNKHGYKNRAGRPWSPATLYDMVVNEKYLGIYTWNKRRKQERHTPVKKDVVIAEGVIPAIVTGELAEKVKKRWKLKKKVHMVSKHVYLLSGRIYCGICGSHLHGTGGKKPMYRCPNVSNNHPYIGVSKKRIENYVLKYIKHFLKTVNIEEAVRIYKEQFDLLTKFSNVKTDTIKAELEEVTRQIENVLELAKKGVLIDDVLEEARKLEERKRELEMALQQAGADILTPEELEKVIKTLREMVEDPTTDPYTLQDIVRMAVRKVVVYEDGIFEVKMRWEGV